MRSGIIASIILVLATAVRLRRTPPANSGPNNKAVNSKNENNPGAPVAGANSFTEGQAKSRIESHSYSSVTELKRTIVGFGVGKL
jgi:hypothetical protein